MSAAHSDRNLLFGVLALQMDFISRDALVAALNSWVMEKSRPLGQILIEQGALAEDSYSVLEAVLVKHLQLHDDEIEKSLAAIGPIGVIHDELQQIADVDVQASLQQFCVARSGEVELGSTVSFSAGRTTSDGNRFHVLRPHAHGGLGEVYVARDDELNREVALKEIKRTLDCSPDMQARFIREAEITGRLEHPGVVPVYGMGKYADGRPYYAMRFVKGESLKEAIEGFHKAADHSITERMLGLRNLLNRLIDVCNTIEYAHSRGVLHRDLKPSNIMLGKYGETLVVDWGLAKALGERDTEAEETELTLIPSSGSGSSETVAGSAIGTPAYMSPEQAEGRIEKISAASDVYSLGATLYALLTGKEPFAEQNLAAVLAKVRKGEFVSPRECASSVPPPLNAVCLKAMSLRPADRYESCAALASDIEHWLADEPVTSFREPLAARSARWIKRHRGLAAGSAVLLAALVVGLVVGTVILGRANSRILAANAQIADEAKRADVQRALAEQREAEATQQLYVSQMNLAQRAWNENNVGRARELLNSLMPEHTAGVDLRGWEWHYLWRLTHSELRILQFMSMCLAFTPDGQFLISGSDDGTLKAWNASGTREMWSVQAHSDRVTRLAVSSDGDLIATRGRNGDAKLWESTSGREIRTYPSSPGKGRGMTLSRNGDRLATATEDIIIWDTPTGHTRQVDGLAFFPDGQRLASCSDDGTARVWDAKTGQELRTLFRQSTQVKTVAVSPDGRSVATGDFVGAIRCWDGETGQELPQFAGHPHKVTALAYSNDGKRLASTSSDTTLKLWDSETGRETQTIRGHESNISDVALASSGDIIASGSWDGTIRLWDAASRQEPW
jgi:eukaryotic-like serine/threonine-protein kinase